MLNSWSGFGQCSETNPATVTITSDITDHTFCAGETITFATNPQHIGPNPTFQWRVNGVNRPGATNSTFPVSNLQDGHVITVVMNPNCEGQTAVTSNSITVKVNAIPSAPAISGDNSVCAGDSINLSAINISGATYSWTGPNGFTSPGKDLSRTGASTEMAGTYNVTATVNGCTS
ncbi:MAG TPA: hypothetical protein VK941_04740, partial [Gillisia sp.]|nr:hypothetical protein [Gillisia sp.]